MNADLEKTIADLGGEYRAVVDRLAASPTPEWRPVRVPSLLKCWMSTRGGFAATRLAAASLVAACAAAVAFACAKAPAGDGAQVALARTAPAQYTLAFASGDSRAVGEIVKTQLADGSWGSDWLTRQNAAALRLADPSGVAYRRALRYLRAKGLSPLTDAELRERANMAI
jgi:hypothetical protein